MFKECVSRFVRVGFLSALGFAAATSCVQAADPPYQNGVKVADFTPLEESWRLPSGADGKAAIVDVDAGIYHRGVRVTVVNSDPSKPWAVPLNYRIGMPVKQGDDIAIKFWARAPQSNKISVYIEAAKEPYDKAFSRNITLTPDWKEYEVRGKAMIDYTDPLAQISIHLAYATGDIELTGVRCYFGQLPPAADGITIIREDLLLNGLPALSSPSVLKNGDFVKDLADWDGLAPSDRCKTQFFDVKDLRFPRYLNVVTTPHVEDKAWSVAARQSIAAPIKKGETVVVRVWLRSPQSGKVAVIVEQSKAPFAKILDNVLRLTPEWKQYEVRGVAAQAFAPGSTRLSLYMAFEPLTVEIANVQLARVP